MSTFQRDELLTQSKILEKETSPAKEAPGIPKQSLTKRGMVTIYNRAVLRSQQLCYS